MFWWSLLVIGSSLSLLSATGALDCSRSYVGDTGVLTSYNFPFDYRHNLSCTYRIVLGPPDGPRTVCFTFKRFALERSTPFCSYDYVRFENTKYCGGGLWQYGVETSSPESNVWHKHFCWPAKKNHFDVTFQSDNNLNGAGFYAEYRVLQGPPPDYTNDVVDTGHAPCGSHQWTCFNRKCVNVTALCNGVDECGDGSDETYTHARCPEKSVMSCDFSSDIVPSDGQCGFVQQDGEWFRTNTKASPYGPRADHTNGTEGYYMYTDSDHSPAYLVSPEINLGSRNGGQGCLSFWYYIYGRPAAAILRVYLGRVVTYTSPEWERKMAEPNTWLKGEVTIQTDKPLQVTFGAVLGNSFSGIALDDMSVTEKCTGGDISCNFESTLCGWSTLNRIADVRGNLTWRRHNRLLSSEGPLEDHSSTDGSGSYLLVKTDPSQPSLDNNRALFVSPFISSINRLTRCLRFWYHMKGSGSESAVLRTRLLLADGRLTGARWSQNARFQHGWRQMALQLVEDQPFQIILEGVLDGATGQIAIDEIQLQNGVCPEVDSGACAGGEFLCGDGSCIPSVHKCDGITHCQDGSDEDWRAACPKTTTTPTPTVCPVSYFQCASDGRCIASTWLCDNFKDCEDGSDESHLANCNGASVSPISRPTTVSPCGEGRYNCDSGECINLSAKCNNVQDCPDGSDEGASANCTGFSTTPFSFCGSAMFTCATGRECISEELVCDGKPHCADGSDEEATTAACARPINTQGLGTSGAVGLAIALLVILTIIILPVVLCRRRKAQQRQDNVGPHNTTPETNTPDISTISYGDDASLSRPLEDSLRHSIYRPGRREGSSRMVNPVNELQRRIDQMDETSRQSCIEDLERYMIQPRRVQPLPAVPTSRVCPDDIVNPNDYILALRSAPVHPPPYSIRDYQNLQCQTEGSDHPSSSGVYSLPPDEPPPPYDGRKDYVGGNNNNGSQRPSTDSQGPSGSQLGNNTQGHNQRLHAHPILPPNHRNLISQTLPHGISVNNTGNNDNESNPLVSSQPVMTYSHSSVRLGPHPGHATLSQPILNSLNNGRFVRGYANPRRMPITDESDIPGFSPNQNISQYPHKQVNSPKYNQTTHPKINSSPNDIPSPHHRGLPQSSSNESNNYRTTSPNSVSPQRTISPSSDHSNHQRTFIPISSQLDSHHRAISPPHSNQLPHQRTTSPTSSDASHPRTTSPSSTQPLIHHRSFPSNSSNASLSSLQAMQQPFLPQRRSPSHHSNTSRHDSPLHHTNNPHHDSPLHLHSHHDSLSSQSTASHQSHPSSNGFPSRVGSPVASPSHEPTIRPSPNHHETTPIRPSPQLQQVQLQYLPSSSV